MTSREVGKVTVLVLLVTMTCTFVAILILSVPDMNITRRSNSTNTGKLNFKQFAHPNITRVIVISPRTSLIHTIFCFRSRPFS